MAEKLSLKQMVFVALIPVIKTGNRIGKDKTVKSAPLALALDMIAAIIVAPAESPILPMNRIIKNPAMFSTEKLITAKYSGTVIISININKIKLNIYFPRKILIGSATNFKVSEVCVSSSLTKICESPDIAEKNNIIHNNADKTSFPAENVPIENETAVKVTTENKRIAFITYLVLNSCCKSFLKIYQALRSNCNL